MNVPRLRFKEFSGEWEVKKIGELGRFIGGGTPTTQNANFWNGNIPWVSSSDLSDENIFQINTTRFITQEAISKSATKLVPKNSILIVSRVGVGKVAITRRDMCTSQDFTNLVLHSGSHVFIAYLIKIKTNKLLEFNQGTSIKGFVKSDFESLEIFVPSVLEQTKIANFLTAVDEKTAQLTQKGDLLARYKKGVMQQIFSQQLRFKDDDGRKFPDWEVKKFGDVFNFIVTNSFSRESLTYDNGIVKNIHYGDIHKKFKSNFKIENENVPFISDDINISNISEDCYCKEGDLIIADASEDYADIGKSIEIISLNNQKLLAGLHTYIARDLSKKMALGFSGYLMQIENVRLQIKTLATGVSVLGISKGNLAKINLSVPSKPEQTKIANFLTAIDDKISHNQTQLNTLKQYKQGLLQQLFV